MEDLVSPVVRWIMGPSLCFSTVTVMPVPRSFFVSSTVCSELWPSGGLHLYLKGFAESGKETLCPWETRQANSSKTVNCRQVVTGNMVGVDVYLVRLRNEQGRERVREWWLQECPAGDVSCPDLCWDVPEHG